MTYTVIGSPKSRTFRVIWMLEELGQPYRIDPVMPGSDAAKAVEPAGKVPMLRDGDLLLTDSVAICTYLADKHLDDGPALTFQAGSASRARQDALTQFCVDEIDGALWQDMCHSMVLPAGKRLPEARPLAEAAFQRAMKTLERRMGDGPWLMGETFTLPDILVTFCMGWARQMPKWEIASNAIRDHTRRCIARPAHLRAQDAAKTHA